MILLLDESTGDSMNDDLLHLTLVTAAAAAVAGDDDTMLRLLLLPLLQPIEMDEINLLMIKMMTFELHMQRTLMTMNVDDEEMKEVAAAVEANYRDCVDDDDDLLELMEVMYVINDVAIGVMLSMDEVAMMQVRVTLAE